MATLDAVGLTTPTLRVSAFSIQYFGHWWKTKHRRWEAGDDFQVERISVYPTLDYELASWFRKLFLCFSQIEMKAIFNLLCKPTHYQWCKYWPFFFFFGGGGGEQKCLYKNKTCVTVVWRFVSLVTVQCENKHGPLRWCLKSCWVDQTLFTLFSSRLLYVLVVTLRLENMFFFASHKLPFGSSWPNWGREPLCARQECSQGQHYIILEVALDYAAHFSALLSNKYCYFIHRISKYP